MLQIRFVKVEKQLKAKEPPSKIKYKQLTQAVKQFIFLKSRYGLILQPGSRLQKWHCPTSLEYCQWLFCHHGYQLKYNIVSNSAKWYITPFYET